jgi:hypothetical protein
MLSCAALALSWEASLAAAERELFLAEPLSVAVRAWEPVRPAMPAAS